MLDVRSDLQAMRNDMRNILRAANVASEESQRVALRMDNLEFEWLVWNEGQQLDATSPEQQHAEENRHMVAPTLASTLEHSKMFIPIYWDWIQISCNSGGTPPRRMELFYLSSELLPMGLPVSLAPE